MLLLSRIWFLLYDASTSLPYLGTSATSVSLPPGSDVDQFRKAVKFEELDILTGCAPNQLLVYKNKLSYDKRNVAAAGKKRTGEPLKSSSSLDGLGTTEKKSLVVVVPPSIQRFQPQPKAFPLCDIPFFVNICNATESDGWISFGKIIPGTSLNKLYIRESYRTIASNIYPDIKKSIISGTPGIGKSLFIFYLLWTLVKGGKRVLFVYKPYTIYYDGKGGVFKAASGDEVPDTDFSFWDDTLWCLFDAKHKTDRDLGNLPYDLCNFVLSTSPRRDLVNDFKKSFSPPVFYMPIWTKPELADFAPFFPHATDWRDRFEILGGIPRHVLEDTTKDPKEMLLQACQDCSLDDLVKQIGFDSTITEKSKIVHLLIHIVSLPPFTKPSVWFASEYAKNLIFEKKGVDAKKRMRELLSSCEGIPTTASLCGHIFEAHVMELLEKGGTFTCRQLVDGNQNDKPSETILHIPPSNRTVVNTVEANQTRNMLHVPRAKNFPAIDAWMPGVGAFQITVSTDHKIKKEAGEYLDILGEPKILYWCLTPLIYKDFTEKSFTKKNPNRKIVQHAILIPLPDDGKF